MHRSVVTPHWRAWWRRSGRGGDPLIGAYNYLDLVPKGRDEEGERSQSWVRRHDEY